MTTFAIQRKHWGREANAIMTAAEGIGAAYVTADVAFPGSVPIGSVEWCRSLFGPHLVNFYPGFLEDRLYRDVRGRFTRFVSYTLERPRFVKDATAWKSDFETALYPAGFVLPPGEWWISEPVVFVNEWRYYVADGSVITTGWYRGADGDKLAPDPRVSWPTGFSGAVDFGELPDGRLALVECHAPFACGWYGDRHADYALWQAFAWEASGWWKNG